MLERESHHDHPIEIYENGTIRWKADPRVRDLLADISLNDLCPLLHCLGFGKNSEVYRKLYRSMGYSLSGYWEVFYWDANNEAASSYRQPSGSGDEE
jgi:hypothetical protein